MDEENNDPVHVPGAVFFSDPADQKTAAYATAQAMPLPIPAPAPAPAASLPLAYPPAVPSVNGPFPPINDSGARSYLTSNLWPSGLQDVFLSNLVHIPIRFFICDDSGSMVAGDGHRKIGSQINSKFVPGTRWQELTDALKFHAGLARASNAVTEFRLLNGGAPLRLGTTDATEQHRYDTLLAAFERSPLGGTPLCRHIQDVTEQIRQLEPQLRATNKKACVIIATDGESSDGDIITAMQPLRSLPVWVVVRLCTDEDRIVEYWNNIDSQLEVEMDVLDDLKGEAQEVNENNPWLTYGEPMHRLREFGVLIKEIDMMDSNKLTMDQVRQFCVYIYGGKANDYPHPELDFKGFLAAVERENKRVGQVWDPVKERMRDWISRDKLQKMHKDNCVVC